MARAILVHAVALAALAGCATLPPGADYPKEASAAFDQPRATSLGREAIAQADSHPRLSGFRLFPRGVDGLLLRAQLIRRAERSLDIQYFIFIEDATGKLLLEALLQAADRGVRVRLLIDDLNTLDHAGASATLAALNKHGNIQLRYFNPFTYRGSNPLLRRAGALLDARRVNHRMHNKLFVADGAVAIVGGRNVGDGYFEAGTPAVRFGDFDIAAVGPVVGELGRSFDEYWNCALAIPQEALPPVVNEQDAGDAGRSLALGRAKAELPGLLGRMEAGDPLAGLLRGSLPLTWAPVLVVADPPAKAAPVDGRPAMSPIERELTTRIDRVERELLIISPYFIPGREGLRSLQRLRSRNARVEVLTNSLASTDVPMVHAKYKRYRKPLLDAGVELYEVRAAGRAMADGSGFSSGRSEAPFALHAKALVFDRRWTFLGSANLDPRSLELNTEVGLIVDSPALASQVIAQFEEFAGSVNSYRVTSATDRPATLQWRAHVDGRDVVWPYEPDTTPWQRMRVEFLSLLPIEGQL